jgi:hypothetical protein
MIKELYDDDDDIMLELFEIKFYLFSHPTLIHLTHRRKKGRFNIKY